MMDAGAFNVASNLIPFPPPSHPQNPFLCATRLFSISLLPREIDTVLRVAAVKACVGAKFALAVSENIFF